MKSVPLHLLVESREHVISVEVSSGHTYQGKLEKSEDNMNMQLSNVIVTDKQGQTSHLNNTFIRGSHVVMVVYPELLRNAPALRPAIVEKLRNKASKKRKPLNKKNDPKLPPSKKQSRPDYNDRPRS